MAESIMDTTFHIAIVTLCLAYAFGNLLIFRFGRKIPILSEINAPPPATWPSVSIVVPACNEEKTIQAAMSTFMDLDYPDYEIIAVNDRSTDETGALMDELADKMENLRVIHITDLPTSWLGKVHAMHIGSQKAKGDFVIYSDADVHFAPHVLRETIALAIHKKLDHCTMMPGLTGTTFSLECLINAFMGFFSLLTGAGQVNDGDSDRYVGAGAFNLVRRELFEKTEGWEWLRLEIADDVGLAYLMHRHGAKSYVVYGKRSLFLSWYDDIPSMIRGMEKNSFAAATRFSVLRAVGASILVISIWAAPLASFLTPFWGLGALVVCTNVFTALTGHSVGHSRLAALLSSAFVPLFAFILLRSMYVTLRNKGIYWRGTFYPLKELKENQRVKL